MLRFDRKNYERQRAALPDMTGLIYRAGLWALALRMKMVVEPPEPLTAEEMCGAIESASGDARQMEDVLSLIISSLERMHALDWRSPPGHDIGLYLALFDACFQWAERWPTELRKRLGAVFEAWAVGLQIEPPDAEDEARWREFRRREASGERVVEAADTRLAWILVRELRE